MINRLSALVRMACCFTAGVAVCRMRQAVPAGVARHAPAAALAICAALAACVLFRAGFLLPPVLFAGLIFCLSFQAGVVDRWFSSGPAMLLGKISFPLYLLHITPLAWIEAHLRGARLGQAAATGVLAAYVTACLVAAYLLHRAVEQPLHRWARQGFPLPRLGSRSRVMSLDPIDPNS